MTFDPSERTVLAALADVLIPAAEGMPSASQAGVAQAGLDQVLAVRPDLAAGLKQVVQAAQNQAPAAIIAELAAKNPAGFAALAEFAASAYFLNPEVSAALGYRGQGPVPIDPAPDYLAGGLLQSAIDRGPIYRPTPPREDSKSEI